MSTVETFLAQAPKAELHLHLVGSASIDTVAQLAARHPAEGVPASPEMLNRWFEFRDFSHFIQLYARVSALVKTGEDVAALVTGAATDLASHRGVYAEMTVTPYLHMLSGISYPELVEGLEEGHLEAQRLGVELAWIYDIPGEYGQVAATATLDAALDHPPTHLVGFGLAGAEAGINRRHFAWAFDRARAAGLRSVPHAGEGDGPASVWAALESLCPDRIGHGVRAIEDQDLVERLVKDQIPLEVCASSNVRTRVYPSLEQHPIGELIEAGVFVTVNTDDPHMFGTNLTEEYRRIAAAFDLELAGVTELVANSIRASFLPEDRQAILLNEITSLSA